MKTQLFALAERKFNFGDENLGIARLTAYLKQNNKEVNQTYMFMEKNYLDELSKIDLDCSIFGFSVYSDGVDYCMKVVDYIKSINKNAICLVGSKFVSLHYETLVKKMNNIDYFILGDGEYTLLELINCIEENYDLEVLANKNMYIATKNNYINKKILSIDIKQLPLPDRDYLTSSMNIAANICDAHGCNGNCSFCGLRNDSARLTLRNAKELVAEIEEICNKTGINIFLFTSGSFEIPGKTGKKRINEFCDLIIAKGKKYAYSFRCFIKAESFQENKEDIFLLNKMKNAGFDFVLLGIESGNEKDLKVYNKHANLKDNISALKLMREANIYCEDYGFIMYNPYSTIETLQENYNFLVNNKSPYLKKYIDPLWISENTALYERVKKDGLLREDYSYNNQSAYKFVDNDVEKLYGKVRSIINESPVMGKHYNFTLLCYSLFQVKDFLDTDTYYTEYLEIQDNLFTYLSEFFKEFYYNLDFPSFKVKFALLESQLDVEYEKSKLLRIKVLRSYMKYMRKVKNI